MNHTIKLLKDNGKLFQNVTSYRRLVGQLLYLTTTRPNISFTVTYLSQFLNNLMQPHYNVGRRILKYLKDTLGHGLFFLANGPLQLKGFSDSDWAGCPESHRSIIGYGVYLCNIPKKRCFWLALLIELFCFIRGIHLIRKKIIIIIINIRVRQVGCYLEN